MTTVHRFGRQCFLKMANFICRYTKLAIYFKGNKQYTLANCVILNFPKIHFSLAYFLVCFNYCNAHTIEVEAPGAAVDLEPEDDVEDGVDQEEDQELIRENVMIKKLASG